MSHPLDHPQITSHLFFPRKAQPHTKPVNNTFDGSIQLPDDESIGYRLHVKTPDSPLIVYFHGNGEVVSDYDTIARMYHDIGASLLVVDYRGYGWSTGAPLTSKMLPDAAATLKALPDILQTAGVGDIPIFIKGRSLGSAPAIYLALTAPESFKGLIIESGFADTPSLFKRLRIAVPDDIADDDTLPINNISKMKRIVLPLLVIHGEEDQLLPVTHGQALFDASSVTGKTILRIPGAGHNDLLWVGKQRYFSVLSQFIQNYR